MYFFLSLSQIAKDGELPEAPIWVKNWSQEPNFRQTASLLGEPFCRQPTSFCPWEKLRAVHCMVFCACLHFVAGNQREGVGQRLSQADLKDEARLCYRSFCQAELSLSSFVPLSQPYKGIAPWSFQGIWPLFFQVVVIFKSALKWYLNLLSFVFTVFLFHRMLLLGLFLASGLCPVPRALPHTAQEENHGGKRQGYYFLQLSPNWASNLPQFSPFLTLEISVDNW